MEGTIPGVPTVDLRPIEALLARIEAIYHPLQVWLFGSRARGDGGAGSDWDLFVIVPDDADQSVLNPLQAWRICKESGVPADLIPCRTSEFREARDVANTLSYVVAREGVLVRGG
ncbi:MAG TPA: nucleotidyltransferase domain-containing protein [Myxococcales bacterium]|jgi:predicted nucleotidyltransferase